MHFINAAAITLSLLLQCLPQPASAHGNMVYPPPWQDPGGLFGRFVVNPSLIGAGEQCSPGCTGQAPGAPGAPGDKAPGDSVGCLCEWYSNYTVLPDGVAPSIPNDSPLRTFQDIFGGDWTKTHPWRAPGQAPVFSPCGIDGGNPKGCPVGGNGACAGGGYGHGIDALHVDWGPDVVTTEWRAGSVQTAGWAITANHGGGYSWRLCKRPPGPSDNTKLSEKCFQQIPLTFVGSNHTVIGCAGYNKTHCTHPTSVSIARMTTTNGTHPSHSEWARNPIPACGDLGSGGARGDCKYPPQFPEPAPGLWGFGTGARTLPWTITDQLRVPTNIAPGDYVLGFRYDCEQTPQVWSSCANIHITAAAAPPAPPQRTNYSNCMRPRAPACMQSCCNASHPCGHCGRCVLNPRSPGCEACHVPLKDPQFKNVSCLPLCGSCYGPVKPGGGLPPKPAPANNFCKLPNEPQCTACCNASTPCAELKCYHCMHNEQTENCTKCRTFMPHADPPGTCMPACEPCYNPTPGPAPSPSPMPPAPPTPPAPPIAASCKKEFRADCGYYWNTSTTCEDCAIAHMGALTAAGCQDADIQKFCHWSNQCPAAEEDYCGVAKQHGGTECTDCIVDHLTELSKAGCTSADVEQFCQGIE